ncbi:hypothetical protein [Clostridium tertium]|uniref:hypothetical protein n=1 Tax=Clostridium tertium TaxID=1559 RepID=UPI0034A4BD6D
MNYIKETVNILKNMENLKKAEENLKYQIIEVRSDLKSTKSLIITDMPQGGSGSPDDRICNLIFKEKQLLKNLKETQIKISKVNKLLEGLSEEDKLLLEKVYCEDSELKTDTDLAKELGISRATLSNKKSRVTKKLAIQLWGIATL